MAMVAILSAPAVNQQSRESGSGETSMLVERCSIRIHVSHLYCCVVIRR